MNRTMERLRLFFRDPKNRRTAAAIVMIAAAVFLFLAFGKNDRENTIKLSDAGEASASSVEMQEQQDKPDSGKIVVDIEGQVRAPGVYQLSGDARIVDAVKAAGGLTEEADLSNVNQAEPLADGQKVMIPSEEDSAGSAETVSSGTGTVLPGNSGQSGSLININTADEEALQELPGVGPALAARIIDYRENSGAFRTVEDLMNVSGIGEKTFEKMKLKITV